MCASYIFLHEIPWCLVAPGPQILHLGVAVALHLRLQCGLYAVQSWHGAGAEVLQLDGHGHLDLVPWCWKNAGAGNFKHKHMDLTMKNGNFTPPIQEWGLKHQTYHIGISPREYHGLTLGLLFLAIAIVSQPLEHILGCWDVSPTAELQGKAMILRWIHGWPVQTWSTVYIYIFILFIYYIVYIVYIPKLRWFGQHVPRWGRSSQHN